jgi:hypothetical protein
MFIFFCADKFPSIFQSKDRPMKPLGYHVHNVFARRVAKKNITTIKQETNKKVVDIVVFVG